MLKCCVQNSGGVVFETGWLLSPVVQEMRTSSSVALADGASIYVSNVIENKETATNTLRMLAVWLHLTNCNSGSR